MDSTTGRVVPADHPNALPIPDHLVDAALIVERAGKTLWDVSHPYEELRAWALANRPAALSPLQQKLIENPVALVPVPGTEGEVVPVPTETKAEPAKPGFSLSTRRRGKRIEYLINGKVATIDQLYKMGIKTRPRPFAEAYHAKTEQKKADKARRRKLQKQRGLR